MATALAHAPIPVKDFLRPSTREARQTYATLRDFIWEHALVRSINAMVTRDPVPTEIDAVGKGGKGHIGGKGKGYA